MIFTLIVLFGALRLIHAQMAEAFLWVYFIGNEPDQEQIHFAVSTNGFDFTALNKDKPVINSSVIADKKAIRDPHIYRGQDGNFYMVCTDMKSNEGWLSNHGIVMLKSKDLITWTYSRVDIRTAFPNDFGTIDAAWAPQTIYDEKEKKYMVYFSMHFQGKGDNTKVIYYSYANADFTALATVPKQLYFPPQSDSNIDGDIVLKDGKYYLFFKTELTNKILRAISDDVTGPYVLPNNNTVQLTSQAAEGSCTYPLGNGTWVLIYDAYANGRYEFTTSTDLMTFTLGKGTYNFTPRHGTIMQISTVEMDRLIKQWG